MYLLHVYSLLLYPRPSIISRFLGPFLSSFIKLVTVGVLKGVRVTFRFKFGWFIFPKVIQSRLKLVNATRWNHFHQKTVTFVYNSLWKNCFRKSKLNWRLKSFWLWPLVLIVGCMVNSLSFSHLSIPFSILRTSIISALDLLYCSEGSLNSFILSV